MKGTIGPMDSKCGYSSEKLTKFFKDTFFLDPLVQMTFDSTNVTDELILSKVTEILLVFENNKELVKLKYRGIFNRSELAYIFQYFNGKVINYQNVYVYEQYYEFIEKLKLNEQGEFSEEKQRKEFLKKITSMYPFEFFVLGYMIIEDWSKVPVTFRRSSLFDGLIDDSSNE